MKEIREKCSNKTIAIEVPSSSFTNLKGMRKHTKKDGLKEQRKEEKRLCCCVEGSVSPRTNAIKIAIAIGLQDMLTKLRCWILSRATSLDMNKLTPE